MDLTPTISLVEALWVLGGLLALPRAALNLRQAWLNRCAVAGPAADPELRTVAWLAVRREAVFVFLQAVLLAIGLRALAYPPPTGRTTWDSALTGAGMIAAQGLLLWLAARTAQDEAALRRAADARRAKRRQR